MHHSIAFFIQARVGSSRLPNKVLLPFDNEKSILELLIQNIQSNFYGFPVVICTTISSEDDSIIDVCNKYNVSYYRGSQNNVLDRFVKAAIHFNVDVIIRVCADNPFINIKFLNELLEFYRQNKNFNYWGFKNKKNIPAIKTHLGLFAEIVTRRTLQDVLSMTDIPSYTEHVTNFIYENSFFHIIFKEMPTFINDRYDLRFTIDDSSDFDLQKEIFQWYKRNNFDIERTISWVDTCPEIIERMRLNIKLYSK